MQEAVAHSFSDWPCQGPQSTIHMAKHMAKPGGDPKSWMQIWMRRRNLAESDRVVHELKTLVDVLYLGGTYDQLNLGSLASFEAVGRRLQAIVEAFSNSSGSTPDWSHARLYTGKPQLTMWLAQTYGRGRPKREKKRSTFIKLGQRSARRGA